MRTDRNGVADLPFERLRFYFRMKILNLLTSFERLFFPVGKKVIAEFSKIESFVIMEVRIAVSLHDPLLDEICVEILQLLSKRGRFKIWDDFLQEWSYDFAHT